MEVKREEVQGGRKPSYSAGLRIFVVLEGNFRVYLTKKGKKIYRIDPMGKYDCLRAGPDFIVGFKGRGELLVVSMDREEFLEWSYFDELINAYEGDNKSG